MLPRLARTAAIAVAIVGLSVVAAVWLDPTLPERLRTWSPVRYAAIAAAWLAATVAAEIAVSRATGPRRGRSLTLPPLRRR